MAIRMVLDHKIHELAYDWLRAQEVQGTYYLEPRFVSRHWHSFNDHQDDAEERRDLYTRYDWWNVPVKWRELVGSVDALPSLPAFGQGATLKIVHKDYQQFPWPLEVDARVLTFSWKETHVPRPQGYGKFERQLYVQRRWSGVVHIPLGAIKTCEVLAPGESTLPIRVESFRFADV